MHDRVSVRGQTSETEEVNLYPNPNSGNFKLAIILSGDTEVLIKITDMQGKLLEEKSIATSNANESFDLSSYKSGMYYVKVQAGEDVRVLKMVKF